jgi:serine/threonine-protein kinase RIO1
MVVEFRHLTVHKGVSNPRNAVNTWCDKECRKLMRLAREAALPGMVPSTVLWASP